jgi:hypothetical protein
VVVAVAVAVLPRMGWLAFAVLTTGWLAGRGAPGAALVVALAAIVPVVLLVRHPARWPLAAVAPALGLAGLAGAWPAIAGRAPSAWQRAGLAATGWIWLVLATPLAGVAPYVQGGSAVVSRSLWLSSPYDAANHLLAPLLRSGELAPALIWAAAAVAVPSITKARRFRVRLAMVASWAIATLVAIDITLNALHSAGTVELGAAALGSVGAGFVALSPMPRLRRPRAVQSPDIEAGLA